MSLPARNGELAALAHAAYAESTGGKTWDGRTMPAWDVLPEPIKEAWRAAVRAVTDASRELGPAAFSDALDARRTMFEIGPRVVYAGEVRPAPELRRSGPYTYPTTDGRKP